MAFVDALDEGFALCEMLPDDRGALTDFRYLAAEELGKLPASPGNQWLVERELAAMPPELAELTRLCAVLGAEFSLSEVEAVQVSLEGDRDHTGVVVAASYGLGALARRRLLVQTDDRFAFRGPAIQDATYALVDEKAKVLLTWMDQGRLARADPYHLIFSIWATTQHYADFDVQVRAVLGKGRNGEGRFEDAARYLEQLFMYGLTPRPRPGDKS